MTQVFRQGDVLLVPVASIPDGTKVRAARNGRHVLAEGEVTGHAHTLDAEQAEVHDAAEAVFVRIMDSAALTHQEHATIELPAGDYKVVRQVEYKAAALPQRVLD